MRGSSTALKSKNQAKEPVSEVKIWLVAVVLMILMVMGSTVWSLYQGNNPATTVTSAAGAAIGLLVGWGGYHLVSRRDEDVFRLSRLSFVVVIAGDKRATFAEAFEITLLIAVVGFSFSWVIFRSMRGKDLRATKKSAPPQSGHLLYDADIDTAVGPGVTGRMGVR